MSQRDLQKVASGSIPGRDLQVLMKQKYVRSTCPPAIVVSLITNREESQFVGIFLT
jgi:hypothetical protein